MASPLAVLMGMGRYSTSMVPSVGVLGLRRVGGVGHGRCEGGRGRLLRSEGEDV